MSEITYTVGKLTLDDVVQEALEFSGRPESDYDLFFQAACRGYLDLRLHAINEGVKVQKITISDINKVPFPNDFIDFVSIAVVDGGKAWLLSPNDEFIKTTTEVAGIETQDSDEGEGVDIIDVNNIPYNIRGGQNTKGYYDIEWDKERIAVINTTATKVLLSYQTSGVVLDGTTYIPLKAVPTLQAYCNWWSMALNPRIAVSQKEEAKRLYYGLRQELRESDAPSLTEFEEKLYRSFNIFKW